MSELFPGREQSNQPPVGLKSFYIPSNGPERVDVQVTSLDWQERSLCRQSDPEAFFVENGASTSDAKKVCNNCDVRAECLKYALDNDELFGVWGGLSEYERRKLKKRN